MQLPIIGLITALLINLLFIGYGLIRESKKEKTKYNWKINLKL